MTTRYYRVFGHVKQLYFPPRSSSISPFSFKVPGPTVSLRAFQRDIVSDYKENNHGKYFKIIAVRNTLRRSLRDSRLSYTMLAGVKLMKLDMYSEDGFICTKTNISKSSIKLLELRSIVATLSLLEKLTIGLTEFS